jgi:hypothetical protein
MRDGRCDAADVQIFQNAVGTCRGEVGYDPLADIDGSGCVDASDHFDLFEADRDGDGIPTPRITVPTSPTPARRIAMATASAMRARPD